MRSLRWDVSRWNRCRVRFPKPTTPSSVPNDSRAVGLGGMCVAISSSPDSFNPSVFVCACGCHRLTLIKSCRVLDDGIPENFGLLLAALGPICRKLDALAMVALTLTIWRASCTAAL
jgi:hypothetical protein